MKKVWLLALATVLALGSLGVGYAYWNDSLDIGQNPVETGEAKVVWSYTEGGAWARIGTPASASWSQIDDHTFSVSFSNLYPGCKMNIRGYTRNVGTIPMKFDRCDITVPSDPGGVAPYIFVSPGDTYMWWDQDGSGPLSGSGAWCPVWGGHSNFPFTSLDDALNDGAQPGFPNVYQLPKFVLDPPSTPGDYSTAGGFGLGDPTAEDSCWNLILDPNAPDSIEGATLTFTISFTFKQAVP